MVYDLDMLGLATVFAAAWEGETIHIERYTNHGRLFPDGQWAVCYHNGTRGSQVTNPRYLNGSRWLYKAPQLFPSWRAALDHLRDYAAPPGTRGWAGFSDGDPYGDDLSISAAEDLPR